jgi:hypothetical protein
VGLREVPGQLTKLVDALRATDGLTVKGKSQSTFYIGTKPFLHFHDGPGGLEADVKWADRFVREPVETHAQRVALLKRVHAHLAGGR